MQARERSDGSAGTLASHRARSLADLITEPKYKQALYRMMEFMAAGFGSAKHQRAIRGDARRAEVRDAANWTCPAGDRGMLSIGPNGIEAGMGDVNVRRR